MRTDTDTATGTKAARPQWNAGLTDLRPGDTLICGKLTGQKILARHPRSPIEAAE